MPGYLKIVLIILVLLYIFSPYDLFPDLFPPFGWLDDGLVLGLLIYFLRKGALPSIISSIFRRQTQSGGYSQFRTNGGANYNSGQTRNESKSGPKNPYEILGVSPKATLDEIHAAFREAAQQYHPDKVSHLGPDLQALANKKFIEIQEAYDELRKARGD